MIARNIDDFTTHCVAVGLSQRTVHWYHSNLRVFAQYIGKQDYRDPNLVQAFIASLRSRDKRWENHPKRLSVSGGLSDNTIRGYIRTLKRFFHWLVDEERIIKDPTMHLAIPKRKKHVPRGISQSDYDTLFKVCDNARDRALLMFLRSTGARASEVAGVRKTDVNLKDGLVLIVGKGGQERFTFLNPKTQEAIETWLKIADPKSEFLFQSRQGKFLASTLSQLMRRLKRRAGIKGKVNPHAFRHAFARDWLQSNGDLSSLSQVMGHSDISTTMIYSVLAVHELQEKHRKHSPLR
jgi:integrase/recombinase XerD